MGEGWGGGGSKEIGCLLHAHLQGRESSLQPRYLPLTGNQTCNPLVCRLKLMLRPLSNRPGPI